MRAGRGDDVSANVREIADRVAALSWQAAPIYIVDVGDVDGALRVMELDPFSGAASMIATPEPWSPPSSGRIPAK